jgi:hypothetical protein
MWQTEPHTKRVKVWIRDCINQRSQALQRSRRGQWQNHRNHHINRRNTSRVKSEVRNSQVEVSRRRVQQPFTTTTTINREYSSTSTSANTAQLQIHEPNQTGPAKGMRKRNIRIGKQRCWTQRLPWPLGSCVDGFAEHRPWIRGEREGKKGRQVEEAQLGRLVSGRCRPGSEE